MCGQKTSILRTQPSVGANLAPECGGNIRGSKKEYQRQELAA